MTNIITLNDIINYFSNRKIIKSTEYRGDVTIRGPAPIKDSMPGDICFCGTTAKDPLELLDKVNASVLIIDNKILIGHKKLQNSKVLSVIYSDNARLDFIRVILKFFKSEEPKRIHPSSVISSTAKIEPDVNIGPLCTIGDRVQIKSGTFIHSGVHIYEKVKIGRNVTINSGTVIGADGFGYEKNKYGKFVKFPHIGNVVIEDDVEIGCNACIDRGTLGDTVISKGVKIDNLVHISHNVFIGKHSAIIANTMVGGGTIIGDYSWIAPSACLRDRINIGNNSTIGLGSIVTKNLPESATYMGSPARDITKHKILLSHWNEIVNNKIING